MHKKKTEEMEADHQEFTRLICENQAILYDFINAGYWTGLWHRMYYRRHFILLIKNGIS